jgi:hypothetical protein
MLRPNAKKANQVSTTAFKTIDSQLSKNRAVGRHARHRMNSGPIAITKVRKSLAKVTTKSAMHRKITLPRAVTTAAKTKSSRMIPASLSRSRTSRLACSLNASRSAYGDVTVIGSVAAGRNVVATPVASSFALSATLLMQKPE